MSLLKKNLAFGVLVLVCLLVFAVGAYLAVAESTKLAKAQKKIKSSEAQLKSLAYADPAPTTENVIASEQNVAQLAAELLKIREDLQRGSKIDVSTDGVRVMASIQQYISDSQRRLAAHTNKDGEVTPIETPKNFAFGFGQYINEASAPENAAVIPVLDKQRQILSYLLNQLIDADPQGIKELNREALEVSAESAPGFTINPAISARVPDAIDTMAFSVTFTGYTNTLRRFLNNLAQFELPIVVRSIEVDRPPVEASTTKKSKAKATLDDIFGVFSSASEAPKEAQKPVISENISSFTVILEFIDIILPSESEENPD